MRRAFALLGVLAVVASVDVSAQAVPENSSAARLNPRLRRWPTAGIDPFRHAFWPHWGLVIQAGGSGANNALNAKDVGAILFLSDRDSLRIGSIVDAFGLVPQGQGVRGWASAEGGAYLGGPLGGRLSLGLSAQGRGYGQFLIDDDAVRLFREGNLVNQTFAVGNTSGSGLVTVDGGVHLLVNAGPLGSVDGAQVTLGFGGRLIRPVVYARAEVESNSTVALTDSSIAATVTVDEWHPDQFKFSLNGGSGLATDLLLRLTWPTSGIAVEAMVANVSGTVTVDNLTHEQLVFNVNTTSLQELSDSINAADSTGFVDLGVVTRKVKLPRTVRFAASAWANRILQLDVAATLPVTGEFESPLLVEMGSTWRLLTGVPLRAGLMLGGNQGIGYTGGFGLESNNVLLRLTASSLGGLFRKAKGASGRFEFGFFF